MLAFPKEGKNMKKLKCYFSQAITLLKQEKRTEFLEFYDFVEKCLKKHQVIVFNPAKKPSSLTGPEIYQRDLAEINKSDFVIAEVSIVSWGVGQELTYAIIRAKPILILHNTASSYGLSEMIRGAGLEIHEYDGTKQGEWKKQITRHIAEFIEELRHYLYLKERLCAKIP